MAKARVTCAAPTLLTAPSISDSRFSILNFQSSAAVSARLPSLRQLVHFEQRIAGARGRSGNLRGVSPRGEIDDERGIAAVRRQAERPHGRTRIGNRPGVR